MTKILEIKDKVFRFYGEYETFIYPVIKFIMALTAFLMISMNIGFMEQITSPTYAIVLALLCALLPVNAIIWIGSVLILLNMYTLSLEVAIVTLCVFAVIYLIYFRFAPEDGIALILTPIMFRFNVPYIMPVGIGLFRGAYSVVAGVCGTIFYYFIDGIKQNSSTFVELANDKEADVTAKFNVTIGQIFNKPEMYLVIVIFIVSTLCVYFIRRIKADHAWTLAIVTGILVQVIGLFVGYIAMGISGKEIGLIVGNIVSLLIALGLEFLFMNLDYARTERVQFEDDDYYYYVKAVPKKMVAQEEKVVKRFGTTATMGKRIDRNTNSSIVDEDVSRKVMAQELDIDEDLLK